MNRQEVSTARTYAFVGFIFYVLSTIVVLIGVLVFAVFFATSVSTSMMPGSSYPPVIAFSALPLILIFSLLFIPGILLTVFAWMTVRSIEVGKIEQARTNSLILGIVGLFFGLFIGGIFFLLAYAKLGETYAQPYTAQSSQRFCTNCGRAVQPDARFCSHCGKELPP